MTRNRFLFAVFVFTLGTISSLTHAAEPTTAREYYDRAGRQERDKRYALAIADYSKAIKLDPKFVEAYWNRSALYGGQPDLNKRDCAKAAADLTKVIEIDPKRFSAWYNRGLTYECMGEIDKAIADYTFAIEGDLDFSLVGTPQNEMMAYVHQYRGRAYQWHKLDFEKAVADYSAALVLNPQMEMLHYRRGQAYHGLKEYAKAVDDFRIALEQDPEYTNLLDSLAWLLATCPDPKYRDGLKAVEYASKSNAKWEGKMPDSLDALAAANAEVGEYGLAVQHQKEAIELLGPKAVKKRKAMEDRLKLYEAKQPFRTEK